MTCDTEAHLRLLEPKRRWRKEPPRTVGGAAKFSTNLRIGDALHSYATFEKAQAVVDEARDKYRVHLHPVPNRDHNKYYLVRIG